MVVVPSLFMTGEAGTGKSAVIHAIRDWNDAAGLAHTLRVSAPTATAAQKIRGQTLHAVIGMRRSKAKGEEGEDGDPIASLHAGISDDQRTKVEPIRVLCKDEVSMIGHNLEHYVNGVLSACNPHLAGASGGGVFQIVSGDFFQFKPVRDTPLYSAPTVASGVISTWGVNQDVILLDEQMRQDPEEVEFVSALRGVRKRQVTGPEWVKLNQRVLGTIGGPTPASIADAIVIVARHSLRRQINKQRAHTLAKSHDQPVYVSATPYSTRDRALTITEITKLAQLAPTDHDKLESVIHYTLGMPVVFYDNDHVTQGITNGTYGTVVGIRFSNADSNAPTTGYCTHVLKNPPAQVLVELRDPHPDRVMLDDLPANVVLLEPRKGSFGFITKKWKDAKTGKTHTKSITVKVCQTALTAAWAVTDYRCQGDTSPSIIVDLSPPPSGSRDPAANYVVMSRVTKFSGLAFLRSFAKSELCHPLPSDLQAEIRRQIRVDALTCGKMASVSTLYSKGWLLLTKSFSLLQLLDKMGWKADYITYIKSKGYTSLF